MAVRVVDNDVLLGCLLPVQFNEFARRRRYAVSEGERNLMVAVLADAIHCYLTTRNHKTREEHLRFLEVKAWFEHRGTGSASTGFAYETVCDALGIDPDLLRGRLRATALNNAMARRRKIPKARIDRTRSRGNKA